jgi:hypothetical protein
MDDQPLETLKSHNGQLITEIGGTTTTTTKQQQQRKMNSRHKLCNSLNDD